MTHCADQSTWRRCISRLPLFITVGIAVLMLAYGVIEQPANYRDFADHSTWAGVPHAADVFQFRFCCRWPLGRWQLSPHRTHRHSRRLVRLPPAAVGLVLTAAGSTATILPRMTIACSGIACRSRWPVPGCWRGVRAETVARYDARSEAAILALLAVVSVVWWYATSLHGAGDLRPYLLLQLLPILLVPLWQALHGSDARDRLWFGAALAIYVVAKAAELNDHELLATAGLISGHTAKHLLATLAAALIVGRLVRRSREARPGCRTGLPPDAKAA
ncbi:MAG: hypothetical protein IPL58_01815 [Betaproteobacteria bacterium]|uniref:Alkaline phytoceramidase n=1 Tax=Candidatus Proximibacter danicus TaxID=2954365 RepID=A0A9D7JY93_9PROT|nr:hypothetical protein [Candidatus Proximibacter danicus]